jgi:hypothetical protein
MALRGGPRTETAVVAAERFFVSVSTLLGVLPVSSLTRLETLLLSSVCLLATYGDGVSTGASQPA